MKPGAVPLAGPVVAAACVFPEDLVIDAINDSKQMTEEEREEVYETLMANDQVIKSVCIIDHNRIDEHNILEASLFIFISVRAISMTACFFRRPWKPWPNPWRVCPPRADWVLIDGNRVPPPLVDRAEAIVKGDAKSVCISAASVLAKVTRDRMMVSLFSFFILVTMGNVE